MPISPDQEATFAAEVAANAIAEKKGLGIALLDVSRLLVITDVFVIATGTSTTHVKTLVDEVEMTLKRDHGRMPLRREGESHGKWVLLDYGDMVVHVFDQVTRDYYDLERLWGDAPRLAFEPAAAEA